MMKRTGGVTAPLNNVIMVVAILGLVATQTFGEASNCPTPAAESCYYSCRPTFSAYICDEDCGCTTSLSTTTSSDINRFCKLGCESSVCSAISTLQPSAGNTGEEAVKEEVERCKNSCANICSKGFDAVISA